MPYKIILLSIISSFLVSCAHVKSKEENLSDFNTKKVGAIISGCRMLGKERNWILKEDSWYVNCAATWKNLENNETIGFYGNPDLRFLTPGKYRFAGFSGTFQDMVYSYYPKHDSNFSFLTDFEVKPGEIKYIGYLKVDTVNAKAIVNSFNIFYTTDKKWLEENIHSLYPTLSKKILHQHINLSDKTYYARKHLPVMEPNK